MTKLTTFLVVALFVSAFIFSTLLYLSLGISEDGFILAMAVSLMLIISYELGANTKQRGGER